LAGVLAKSRLMSVVQEFRIEKHETGINVQQPTDSVEKAGKRKNPGP
jgi:hypothetical protein